MIRTVVIRRRLVALSMALSGCSSEHQAHTSHSLSAAVLLSERSGTSIQTTQAAAQVVYYGKTATGRGWLIYLDFERGEGVRYAPLRNYGLCEVRRDSMGTVSWFFTVRADTERFAGTLTPTGLNGVVTLTRGSTGRIRRDQVELQRARLSPNAPVDTAADVFANVNYIQSAGDRTGAEMVFLKFAAAPVVLLTMFEGTPDGPWAMTDVSWAGDTLRGAYGASTSRIRLIRDSQGLRGPWGEVLKKQQDGVRGLLLARPHTSCK